MLAVWVICEDIFGVLDLEYVSRDLAFAAQADAHGDVKRWSLQEENMELCIWGSARLCPVCLPELLSGVHFFK